MSGSTTKPARSIWSGKWAFILAAAASAVGLGNIWRFPYLAAKYGGGMFLLTYVLLIFTFGITLMILEVAIGRKTGLSALEAFKQFGKKYSFIGVIVSSVPFIIAPYYCIIGGWVMKYASAYVTNTPAEIAGSNFFGGFITSEVESFLWMAIFMAVVFMIVALGVKGGIEKANLIMMPSLIIMAVALSLYTISQPGAMEGVLYYIKPDFSKLSPELIIAAMGQMFYSLSLATGIMITYGSYLSKKEDIVQSACHVGLFDLGVSFLAGLTIVPASFVVMGGGDAVAAQAGPSLMFGTLPVLFEGLGGAAPFVGGLFFLLVMFAAITSAISLTETCVSIIHDATSWSRKRSLIVFIVFCVSMGIVINMGYNRLSFIEPLGPGSSMLDLFDFVSNTVLMPISTLLTCVFVGWVTKPKMFIDEVKLSGGFRLAHVWTFMVKYAAPVFVVVILVAYVAAQFGFFSM